MAGDLAAFGGLTGRLLPEQVGEDLGLAVLDIPGRGEQRDWAGRRQGSQMIQRGPRRALGQAGQGPGGLRPEGEQVS